MEALAAVLAGIFGRYIIRSTLGEGLDADLSTGVWDWALERFGGNKADTVKRSSISLADATVKNLQRHLRKEGADDDQINRIAKAVGDALEDEDLIGLLLDNNVDELSFRRSIVKKIKTTNYDPSEKGYLEALIEQLAKTFIETTSRFAGYEARRDAKNFEMLESLAKDQVKILASIGKLSDKEAEAREQYAKRYREAIKGELDYVEILGLDDIDRNQREAKLSVAYLSLTLQTGSEDKSYSDFAQLFGSTLVKNKRVVIEGGAGSGKSTMLRWSVLELIELRNIKGDEDSISALFRVNPFTSILYESFNVLKSLKGNSKNSLINSVQWNSSFIDRYYDMCPFLIRLRQFPDGDLPEPAALAQLSVPLIGIPPPEFAEELLRNGRALLLFDGVDEIPEGLTRDRALRTIGKYAQTYPDSPIIVSSRPGAFLPSEVNGLEDSEICSVDDLSSDQQAGFVRKWHEARAVSRGAAEGLDYSALGADLIEKIELTPELARIASNPLLCAAICALHEKQPETLPVRERDLCARLTTMLLTRDRIQGRADPVIIEEFGAEYALDEEKRRQLLAHIAAAMVRRGQSQLSKSAAASLIPGALKEIDQSNLDPEKMTDALAMRSPPLRGCSGAGGTDAVEFAHNRFKEWLASTQFVSDDNFEELINHAEKEDFAETLVMAAAAPDRRAYASRLVDGLMARAAIETPRSKLRRSLNVLALRAALAAPALETDLRARVAKLQGSLLPPRSMDEARALSLAGDVIVDRLRQKAKARKADECARCIRCLGLIGSPKAKEALATYKTDDRLTVLKELVRFMDPADLPALWRPVGKTVSPPDFAVTAVTRLPKLQRDTSSLVVSTSPRAKIGLTDLGPLQELTKLQYLALNGTQVADLSPLAGLTKLEVLALSGTAVSDLSPLAELAALHSLYLDRTEVIELTSLAGLDNLAELWLSDTATADLSPLAGLSCLETLGLDSTKVADLSPLAKLYRLKRLSLTRAEANGLAPLAGLSSLERLELDFTQVVDLLPVSNLNRLTHLTLHDTDVDDLSPLAGLHDLTTLDLSETKITDLSPLSGLTKLEALYLNATNVFDLAPLTGLSNLNLLTLSETLVSDLSPLANLQNLQFLNISFTRVSDISPVSELHNLSYLLTSDTEIDDFSPLESLKKIERFADNFFVNENSISQIEELFPKSLSNKKNF